MLPINMISSFADVPPYGMEDVDKLPELIFQSNYLEPEGCLFSNIKKLLTSPFTLFTFFNHRVYGNVNFTFLFCDK